MNSLDTEDKKIKQKPKRKKISPFMVLSFICGLLYTAIVGYKFLNQNQGTVLFYILVAFTAIYFLLFLVRLVINIFNKKATKTDLEQNVAGLQIYRRSLKILKYLMIFFNLLTAAILAFQTGGSIVSQIFAIAVCVFAGGFALYSIFRNARKIKKTINKNQKKQQKRQRILEQKALKRSKNS